MKMKIEKNVPPPVSYKIYKETAMKMEIGDSVLFDDYDEAKKLYNQIRLMDFRPAIRNIDSSSWRVWKLEQ